MKGGGDAVSAARAVLQTGEYDFAWNMQVEDEILQRLEKGGKGTVDDRRPAATSSTSSSTPPTRGPRSTASAPASRPSIRCSPTRRCARRSTCWSTASRCRSTSTAAPASRPRNFLNNPARFVSKNTKWEFNVDKANQLLDDGRLEEGRRRHPREGRQEAEVRLPDLDQRAAPEDPGDRQAGLPEGRHRHRAEVGHGVGVLLLRRRQPRHLPAFLLRHPDVHDDHDAARSRAVHAPVHRRGRSPPRRTSGRAATSRAGSNEEYDKRLQGRPRPSSTRSSARRCSSR